MTKLPTFLPDDVRCVVTIGIDFDGPSHEVGRGVPPIGGQSWGRYSARRGIPRHLALLEDLGVPATFFVPGYDAECHPHMVREIDARGYEVAAHGYLHEAWDLSESEESDLLKRTDGILSDLLEKPVRGWRSPSGRKTQNTLSVLRSLGYIYDSSEKDYDLPYRLRIGSDDGDVIIEIPNNAYSLDDFPYFKFSHTPPSEVLAHWQSEFDSIYRTDRFFALTLHPRSGWGSGTPSRTRVLHDLIAYIQEHEGVRFFSAEGLANWCLSAGGNMEEVVLT